MIQIPNEFLQWFDQLSREEQVDVKAELIKRTKVLPYYLRCRPTADEVLAVMMALAKLNLEHIKPYRQGSWIKWKFDNLSDRNRTLLMRAFNLVEEGGE